MLGTWIRKEKRKVPPPPMCDHMLRQGLSSADLGFKAWAGYLLACNTFKEYQYMYRTYLVGQ